MRWEGDTRETEEQGLVSDSPAAEDGTDIATYPARTCRRRRGRGRRTSKRDILRRGGTTMTRGMGRTTGAGWRRQGFQEGWSGPVTDAGCLEDHDLSTAHDKALLLFFPRPGGHPEPRDTSRRCASLPRCPAWHAQVELGRRLRPAGAPAGAQKDLDDRDGQYIPCLDDPAIEHMASVFCEVILAWMHRLEFSHLRRWPLGDETETRERCGRACSYKVSCLLAEEERNLSVIVGPVLVLRSKRLSRSSTHLRW